MARTKGAKDKRTRKNAKIRSPQGIRPATSTGPTAPPAPAHETPAREQASEPDRPRSNDDFFRRIEAELTAPAAPTASQAGSGGTLPATPSPDGPQPPAPPEFNTAAVTIDGLASAWQLPFYALAELLRLLGIVADPEPVIAVGRRRAKDLAKPSYPIYEYFVREYLKLNPGNEVHVSAAVTGLNGVGILPDLIEAIKKGRPRPAVESARVSTPGATVGPGAIQSSGGAGRQ